MKNTLFETCKPRASTLEGNRSDLVLDLSDLSSKKITAEQFFQENFLTSGMKELLQRALRRLSGLDSNPLFILKQNMGGGKTHSMVALGLLAKEPKLIGKYAPDLLDTNSVPQSIVLSFSGRSSAAESIWGAFAKQANVKRAFEEQARTFEAPGQAEWESFFAELGPTLILLDELPPFLENAASRVVGNSNHAKTAITGLANMFVAANRSSNVCIVLSDVGAIYEDGSNAMYDAVESATKQLKGEAGRFAVSIEPVKLDSDEIYNILRTRLFEKVADKKTIATVADSYGKALDKSKEFHSGLVESGSVLTSSIRSSYPFHPGIKDLYARFRENPGFYQTRGLIRLMRQVVSNLFDPEKGAARSIDLICAHSIDLGDRSISSEISSINSSLANALSKDISDNGRSHAELISKEMESAEALDLTRLLLMASLANVPNGVHGLSEPEIIKYLSSPSSDFSKVQTALEKLRSSCWYLHESPHTKRIAFKNVENINAKLRHLAQGCSREVSRKRIRAIMEEMYKPSEKFCYQSIAVFPAVDELRSQIRSNAVTLIICEPHQDGLNPDLVKFFNETEYKNRMMFLTGQGDELNGLHERAAWENAAKTIEEEFALLKISGSDPQAAEIKRIVEDSSNRLKSALINIFCDLFYPTKEDQLSKTEFKIELEKGKFNGEQQLKKTLEERGKFTLDVDSESFRKKCEQRLFDRQKSCSWRHVEEKAASKTEWNWHHPNALGNLKERMLKQSYWVQEGEYVNISPPPPSTAVLIKEVSRDSTSGEVVLELTAQNGDRIHFETTGKIATPDSPVVENTKQFRTKALEASFYCVDTSKKNPTGSAKGWTNRITLKHEFTTLPNGERGIRFVAAPPSEIFVTFDGSSPKNKDSSKYLGSPVEIPKGTKIVLAIGKSGAVESEVEEIKVSSDKVAVRADDQATLFEAFSADTTRKSYELLERVQKFSGKLGCPRLYFPRGDVFLDLNTSENFYITAEVLKEVVTAMRNILPDSEVIVSYQSISFETGSALTRFASEMQLDLKDKAIKQESQGRAA
jgi:hypothetical protein